MQSLLRRLAMLKIEIYSLRFYSRLDEDAFFSRLNQIPGVVSVEGFLRTIKRLC
ncbi:Uncharacterised protein [Stenotrophomonas maltophilia]|nr:Uncharacterised protein [Stenotrophomonas maltophilia]